MSDDRSQERAHEIFDSIAEKHLALDGVDIGPMFGSEGLRIRGKVFAFVGRGGALIVKVPQARAAELVASGAVERMVMRERPLREWVVMSPDAAADWAGLVAEALAHVDELTP